MVQAPTLRAQVRAAHLRAGSPATLPERAAPRPLAAVAQPPPPTEAGKAYQRRVRWTATDRPDESELGFDASVPVQAIVLANPEVANLRPATYEVMGEKGTYRLAQRPGA
jgi:hypothetical protein